MKELNDIMWANVWQEKQWPGFDIKLVKVSETASPHSLLFQLN